MWQRWRARLATREPWQAVPEPSPSRVPGSPCPEEGAGFVPLSRIQSHPARPVEVAPHSAVRGEDGEDLREVATRDAGAGSAAYGTGGMDRHREGPNEQRANHR